MLDFGGTLEHEDIKIFNTTGPAVCCQQHGYVVATITDKKPGSETAASSLNRFGTVSW
jgi:hypothetical protein